MKKFQRSFNLQDLQMIEKLLNGLRSSPSLEDLFASPYNLAWQIHAYGGIFCEITFLCFADGDEHSLAFTL